MKKTKRIYLAGGCFWGVEEYFSRISGIFSSTSGYANGKSEETSYKRLKETDHAETVRIVYDPRIISLNYILEYFFKIIDPESFNKQGNDKGRQYRTGIYYADDEDIKVIEDFIAEKSEIYDIAVEVEKLRNFIMAEDYHLDYLKKNPKGYCHIDLSLTPDDHLKDLNLQDLLSEDEYRVLKENGTDRAFSHAYDDFYEKGIYLDKISRKPLFISSHKYNAGCGWPSFVRPIYEDSISYKTDNSLWMKRVEVRSKYSDSHLGHVFNDGPIESGGNRFCINGSSLDFIPLADFDEYGLEKYKDFLG